MVSIVGIVCLWLLIMYLRKLSEVGIFTGGAYVCHKVFSRRYLPLCLEVYRRLLINSLGFMVVDEIEKHLLIWAHSVQILPSAISSKSRREYF